MTTARESLPPYTHTTNLANPTVSLHSTTLPLHLRLVLPTDAPALLTIFSNPQNTTHDPSAANLNTPPAITNLIATWTHLTDPLTRLNLLVLAHGQAVGVAGMGHIYTRDDGTRVGDAGVMINPESRGKGYAYEALRVTIDYALRVLRLDEVTVQMGEGNVEMRGLMERKFGGGGVRVGEGGGDEYCYRFKREEWLGEG